MVCPICLRESEIHIVHTMDSQKIKRDVVQATIESSVCSSCNEEFWTADQTQKNLEAFRAVYRAAHGIISPQGIVSLRQKYDVSQKTMGKLLDIGELTINSYEQGALPSGAHNNLLRFIDKLNNFRAIFERNKKKLSELQIRKISDRIIKLEIADYDASSIYGSVDRDETLSVAEQASQYNGYSRHDMERILSLMQVIIHVARKPLYKMALLKLVFYCDFSYYRDTGHSLTGWRYAKLPYGPVPDDYKQLMLAGEKIGRFFVEPDVEEKGELVSLKDDFNESLSEIFFSPSEMTIIGSVVHKLGGKAASELSRLTHEEDAWLKTENSRLISYTYAHTLRHGA